MDLMALTEIPIRMPPKITYQVESLSAVRPEVTDLISLHWEEIAQFKDVQKLDPDWEQYDLLEQKGRLWIMTARDDGKLVGYIAMLMGYHLHYRKLLTAVDDLHFIHPDYRKGLTGYRLLAMTVKVMRGKGVRFIAFRTKAFADHGALFERLGFQKHDVVYAGPL